MILVVCYAVHDKEIVDIRKFNDYKKAHAFIEEDSRNTYNEEIENGDEDAIYKLEEEKAYLASYDKEYEWTWEIIYMQ